MQVVSNGDKLHEMSNPVFFCLFFFLFFVVVLFWKNKNKYQFFKISSCKGTECTIHILLWHRGSWEEPKRQKPYPQTCAPSEDSDQPALRAVWSKSSQDAFWIAKDAKSFSCGQGRLLSDCADAQADLSLRWAHMWEGTFCNDSALIDFRYIDASS